MGDSPNLRGATQCGQMLDVMALAAAGPRAMSGFLGAAEVDRFGNLNSTWGDRHGETQRLPGSGGACDIACLAQRTVVLLAHERSRFRERVGHITSPGYGRGNGWRAAQGLPARLRTVGVDHHARRAAIRQRRRSVSGVRASGRGCRRSACEYGMDVARCGQSRRDAGAKRRGIGGDALARSRIIFGRNNARRIQRDRR